MTLSTEQIEKLADACGWYQQLQYSRHYKGAGNEEMIFFMRDQGSLTLAGERVVIEKLEFCLTRIRGIVYIMLRDDDVGCETVLGEGGTLSQAIEAAVKAWLENDAKRGS